MCGRSKALYPRRRGLELRHRSKRRIAVIWNAILDFTLRAWLAHERSFDSKTTSKES